MTGAAGFKRDNVSGRGVPDSAGLTGFSYKDSSGGQNSQRGIGAVAMNTQSSLFGFNQPIDDQLSGTGVGNSAIKQTVSPRKFDNETAHYS